MSRVFDRVASYQQRLMERVNARDQFIAANPDDPDVRDYTRSDKAVHGGYVLPEPIAAIVGAIFAPKWFRSRRAIDRKAEKS